MRLFFIPLERELIKKHKLQLEIASEYWIHINFYYIFLMDKISERFLQFKHKDRSETSITDNFT